MVQQQTSQGSSAAYAREMERLYAKESLILVIESKFFLTTKLSLEGPMRLKEDYVEALLDTPTISQEAVPEQLKGPLGQATGGVEQLPLPIRDAFANRVKIPLSGGFKMCLLTCSVG